MSHNVLELAGNTPSRTGDIASIASGDLTNVSGSPASTEALTYNGAAWAPAAAPSAAAVPEVVATLGGFVQAFSLGSAKLYPVGNMYFMGFSNTNSSKVDGYHDLTYARWITFGGSTAWTASGSVNRLELAAGTYQFKFQHITYSGLSSPYVDVRWETVGGASLGPVGRIGTKDQPCNVYGAAVFGVTTTIGLNIIAKSGSNFTPYGSTASDQLFNQKLQATIVRIP